MTKPQLITYIARKVGITKKTAALVLDTVATVVRSSLQDGQGKIRISDLGTFRVIEVKARRGVNPRTGEEMTIPAMKLPRFYPARALKEAIKGQKNAVA